MSEYKYRVLVTAEELIASGEGVAGGEWPNRITRNGLEYQKFDGRGNEMEYTLDYMKIINALQDSLADLLAAAEVRSEELGKVRNFIRELAVVDFTGNDTRLNGMAIWRNRAQALVASWEAETAPEPASGGFTGYVAKIKKVVTRNNEVMATMFINGNECIAFPRTWQEYGKVLESGKELQIVYKEDNSKGYPQFIIESAGLLYEEAESESEAVE